MIKAMALTCAMRANWNKHDMAVYSGLLRGLVTLAQKEVMWPSLSITDGVIEVIMQSRLGCLDGQDQIAYKKDLEELVTLAKNEKTREMRRDLVTALGVEGCSMLLANNSTRH